MTPRKPPLSQHFLTDTSVVARILDAARLAPQDRVLEVGPGAGALTLPMLERVGRLVACEMDPRWARRLPSRPNLEVVEGDFLQLDLGRLLPPPPGWKVVANLPYAVTSPILEKLLLEGGGLLADLWLMVQKEVALRVVSRGGRESGALSLFVQFRAEAELLFTVGPGCFTPPPGVESAVLHVRLRPPPAGVDEGRLFQLVRAAFSQRRKTLRRSLAGLLPDPAAALLAAGIDPQRRPETLLLEDFIALERVTRP